MKIIYRKVPQNKKCCLNCQWHDDCFTEENFIDEEIQDGNHLCDKFEFPKEK